MGHRPGQKRIGHRPGADAVHGLPAGSLPLHHARSLRNGGRPARRTDGQLRGRTHEPRCRTRGLSESGENIAGGQGRLASQKSGISRCLRNGEKERREGTPDRAALRRRRALPHRTPGGSARRRQGKRSERRVRPCLHGRPRLRPQERKGFCPATAQTHEDFGRETS